MISVLDVSELVQDTSKGIEINNLHMFAVNKDGQHYLYWNRCPHLGTPLEWEEDKFLDPDGALIQCTTHGALFQIEDGHCLAGPCKGKHLQAVPFEIEDQQMMVDEKYLKAPEIY